MSKITDLFAIMPYAALAYVTLNRNYASAYTPCKVNNIDQLNW